jgi:uncharacterized protein DUF397
LDAVRDVRSSGVSDLPPLSIETPWQKSSYSGANGCVEVAMAADGVGLRDTKDREGPVLRFSPEEWDAFIAGVRNGEFDLPVA